MLISLSFKGRAPPPFFFFSTFSHLAQKTETLPSTKHQLAKTNQHHLIEWRVGM